MSLRFVLLLLAAPTIVQAMVGCEYYHYTLTGCASSEECGMRCDGADSSIDCGADIFNGVDFHIEEDRSCGGGMAGPGGIVGNAVQDEEVVVENDEAGNASRPAKNLRHGGK